MFVKSLVFLMGVLGLWPSAGWATPIEILWKQSPEKLEITLQWEKTLGFKADYQKDKSELLISFNQPIEITGLKAAMQVLVGWTTDIQVSYDTFFLKPKPGLALELKEKAGQLKLILHNPYSQQVPISPSTLAYKLVQARLWRKQGRIRASMDLLKSLSVGNQKNPNLVVALATAELALGNWAKALSLANEAIALSPENEDLWDLKRAILKMKSTEVFAGKQRKRSVGFAKEDITNYGANIRLWQFFFFGYLGLVDDYEVSQLRPLTAHFPRSGKGQISQSKVYLGFDLPWNVSIKHTETFQEGKKGDFNELYFYDIYGETKISSSKNLPYWGIVEGLLGGVKRNQDQVYRVIRLGPNLEINGALSNRDYLLNSESHIQTRALEGAVRYNWWSPRWLVRNVHRPGLAQVEVSRTQEHHSTAQVHLPSLARMFDQDLLTLQGLLSVDWDEQLNTKMYAGYGINRLGRNSPLVGFDVVYRQFNALEVRLFGSKSMGRYITNVLGLQARWKF